MKHYTYPLLLLLLALVMPDPAISTGETTTPSPSTPPPSTPPSSPPSNETLLPLSTPSSNETLLPLSTTPSSPETETLLPLATPPSNGTSSASTTAYPITTRPTTTRPTTRNTEDDDLFLSHDYFHIFRPPTPRPGSSTCPESDQIHCGTSDRCTRIRYICDGDNDCGDNTDEAPSLCQVWRNSQCERNLARCTRMGRSDCITISNYCTLDDPPCEGNLDRRLCQMLRGGKLVPLSTITLTTTPPPTTPLPSTHQPLHVIETEWAENFEQKLSLTISHPDCPQLYTRVGELCLSVFFIGTMTWLEARAFCRAIGGDLFTMGSNIAPFTTILQHFTNSGVAADFWIGGRYVNETSGWTWVDDTSISMGSPYWAVRYQEECSARTIPYLENRTLEANGGECYHYQQAPPKNTARHCVAATYRHYWYLSDEDCFTKKSPLCVMPGEKKKQAL